MDIEVGGQIQGISLGSFLQIVNMDKTSCTLKIYSSNIVGYLYIVNGELIAAETGSLDGVEAAYEVISWNNAVITIDNAPPPAQTIKMPLMSILMEGLRLKDEKNAQKSEPEAPEIQLEEQADDGPGIEFDPDNYETKDDEIASKFCEPDEATETDIVLDYSSIEIEEPPPVMAPKVETEPPPKEPESPSLYEEFLETESTPSDSPPAAPKMPSDEQLPDEPMLPKALPDEDAVLENEIDDSPDGLMEFDDEVKDRPKSYKKLFILLFLTLIIGGALAYYGPFLYEQYTLRNEYSTLMTNVEKTNDIKQKGALLQKYLNSHGDNRYITNVTRQLNQIEILTDIDNKIREFDVDANFIQKAEALYTDFIKQFPDGEYTKLAKKRIAELPSVVDEIDFNKISNIDHLPKKERLKKYNQYLQEHPKGKYVQKVDNLIAAVGDEYYALLQQKLPGCEASANWRECIDIAETFINSFTMDPRIVETRGLKEKMIEKTELESMRQQAKTLSYAKAKQLFVRYLRNHPNTSIGNEISYEISKLNDDLEMKERWIEVKRFALSNEVKIHLQIEEVKQYIDFNPQSPFINEAKKLLRKLRIKEKNLSYLIAKARQEKLKADKLAKIQEEKERLAQERERQRQERIARAKKEKRLKQEEQQFTKKLAGTDNRFVNNGDRTVTDKRTGRTWVMLDSLVESNQCMTYDQAKEYVRNLNTGGYTDWRLPMPSELAVFYNSPPYYPASGARWYWTAKTATGAWGQNEKTIIFRPGNKDEFIVEHKKQNQCGHVHAVRN